MPQAALGAHQQDNQCIAGEHFVSMPQAALGAHQRQLTLIPIGDPFALFQCRKRHLVRINLNIPSKLAKIMFQCRKRHLVRINRPSESCHSLAVMFQCRKRHLVRINSECYHGQEYVSVVSMPQAALGAHQLYHALVSLGILFQCRKRHLVRINIHQWSFNS